MEGDDVGKGGLLCSTISIHSLRMEGDELGETIEPITTISIHSLRMEGDNRYLRCIK